MDGGDAVEDEEEDDARGRVVGGPPLTTCERVCCRDRGQCLPCQHCGGARPIIRDQCVQPCRECLKRRDRSVKRKRAREAAGEGGMGGGDEDDDEEEEVDPAVLTCAMYDRAIRRAQGELFKKRCGGERMRGGVWGGSL